MKKEIPVLTDAEKLQLLKNSENLDDKEKRELKCPPNKASVRVTLPMCIFFGAFSAALLLLSAGSVGETAFASLVAATGILTPIFTDIAFRKYQNSIIKEISGGKLNSKQYFKLINSGELAKWEQQFASEIENHRNMIKGIKFEEYKKQAEDEIINSVYQSLPQEDGITLNAEEIAKKVSELIEQNNKNNSNGLEKWLTNLIQQKKISKVCWFF